MARYEHLPIYRKSFDLAVLLEKAVASFTRCHKYSLGARLLGAAQDVLRRVVSAQNRDGNSRADELRELRIDVEILKNLLHLAKEVQAFKSFSAYRQAAELAVEIGRQTEGWLKSTVLRAPESRSTNPQGGRP